VARSMVTAACRRLALSTVALGFLLSSVSACSSFEPAKERRYKLLHDKDDKELGIFGAYWRAYDDQHSATFACTNGAAGNHAPSECSHVDIPHFKWDGPKCRKDMGDLTDGDMPDPGPDGSICLQGLVGGVSHCTGSPYCIDDSNYGDLSNIWGAGFGLVFDSKDGWSAREHRVKGVAFDVGPGDLTLGENGLNLRVQIPIVLDDSTPVPPARPLIRNDGSVLGMNGKIYDCESGESSAPPLPRTQTTLGDARVVGSDKVTSALHPVGSPFWQLPKTQDWGPSPVKVGHNEFLWSEVLPPPEGLTPDDENDPYTFSDERILGVHFQVARPPKVNQKPFGFSFCISNLAFILEQ
jgi:hypothetical protein